MRKVAIQGGMGAYHGIAAENYFGEEVEIVPCSTFKDIFISIEKDPTIPLLAVYSPITSYLESTNYP